jgi:hypothetical protein
MTTNYYDDDEDSYTEMERQMNEEKYFDECWDLHMALTDHLEEECIPIMQNCDFSSFYKLCQYGKRYIVDLENIEKQKELSRLKFLDNLNKPISNKKNKENWIVLGKKNETIANLKPLINKEENLEDDKPKNELSKFNWTKKKKNISS